MSDPAVKAKRAEYKRQYDQKQEVKQKSRDRARIYRQTPEGRALIIAYREDSETKKAQREYQREYNQRPEVRERKRKWARERRQLPEVRERRNAQTRACRNRPGFKEKQRTYIQTPRVKIVRRLRFLLWYNIVRAKEVKRTNTLSVIGCTVDELVDHIESQFTDGMTWDNTSEWHIDHIIPCALYGDDIVDAAEQKKCFNYRNLRPLWAAENIRKGDKLDMELIDRYGIQDLLPAHMMDIAI
jgi:hypothetical protein